MLFNSYVFIFLFFPLALLGYYSIKHRTAQLVFLFATSCVFYIYWSAAYILLMLFTVALDFYVAKFIDLSSDQKQRKALLIFSILVNLVILFFFKYFYFMLDSAASVFNVFGGHLQRPNWEIILPIGISFYTFQSMSYVIDVYRRHSSAHGNLLDFATYVTFFPHQISGPLVRHNQIVPQLEKKQLFNPERFWSGLNLFVLGLSKKMLIADRIAPVVDSLILNPGSMQFAEAWIAAVGYTVQIYFDFSGYSDMAVGLGRMMNIEFPWNFNSPYKSKSITDFWKRWHISLSSWLKDYLYVSLGGNRKGELSTYVNLFLTMLIGGLWHGANWTFVVWGMYHGGLLVIERFLKKKNIQINSTVLTFFLVVIGWVFFRANNISDAFLWIKALFSFAEPGAFVMDFRAGYKDQLSIALSLGLLIAFFMKNTSEIKFPTTWKRVLVLAILFVICLSFMSDDSPFLYFQF